MCWFARMLLTIGCALSLLSCAGDGDAGGGGGGGGAGAGKGGGGGTGAGTGGSAGATGGSGSWTGGRGGGSSGAGTTGSGGRGGGAGSTGGGGGGGAWDCLDAPGTLCICYLRASSGAPACSAGFRCCFLLNATSCECFVAEEDCTYAAMQYPRVATCPPP